MRNIKDDACGVGVKSFYGGESGFVFVADFYLSAQWGGRDFARDPIYVCDFASSFVQGLVFADYHAICLRVDAEYVERFSG